jgi:S1-C subfamily serine protease
MYRLWLFSSLVLIFVGITASAQVAQPPEARQPKADQAGEDSALTGSVIQFNVNDSYLGLFLEEVTADRMKELGLTQERGAVVMKVVKDGPAEKAGLKENDVIVSFNGRAVDNVREFQRLLGDTPAGRAVTIEVLRGGTRQSFSATVSKRDYLGLAQRYQDLASKYRADADRMAEKWRHFTPPSVIEPNFFDQGLTIVRPRLGISAEPITDQLAGFFGVKEGRGVLISEVTDGSAAAKAGLRAGDVIVAVDDGKVDSVSDLRNQLSKKQEGPVVFKLVRNHQETSVTVTLEKTTLNRGAQRVRVPGIRFVRPLQTV